MFGATRKGESFFFYFFWGGAEFSIDSEKKELRSLGKFGLLQIKRGPTQKRPTCNTVYVGKVWGDWAVALSKKKFPFTEAESTFSAREFSAFILSKRYTVHVVAIVPIVSQSPSALSQLY